MEEAMSEQGNAEVLQDSQLGKASDQHFSLLSKFNDARHPTQSDDSEAEKGTPDSKSKSKLDDEPAEKPSSGEHIERHSPVVRDGIENEQSGADGSEAVCVVREDRADLKKLATERSPRPPTPSIRGRPTLSRLLEVQSESVYGAPQSEACETTEDDGYEQEAEIVDVLSTDELQQGEVGLDETASAGTQSAPPVSEEEDRGDLSSGEESKADDEEPGEILLFLDRAWFANFLLLFPL